MIVCPMCEHAQAAPTECEVCGRALGGDRVDVPPDVPLLDGVEPTSYAPAPAARDTVAGLEPTAHAPAPDAAADAFDVAQLEATRAAPVDVAASPLADVEPTTQRVAGEARTALPTFPVCRYCRTPALPGERICSRCGMRLPVLAAARPAAEEPARVCGCGARVRGRSCPACGAHETR